MIFQRFLIRGALYVSLIDPMIEKKGNWVLIRGLTSFLFSDDKSYENPFK